MIVSLHLHSLQVVRINPTLAQKDLKETTPPLIKLGMEKTSLPLKIKMNQTNF